MMRLVALGCLIVVAVGCGGGADGLEQRIAALEAASQNTLRTSDLQKEVETALQRLADGTLKRIRRLEEENSPAERIEDLEYTSQLFRKELKQEIEQQKAVHEALKASIGELRQVLSEVDARFEEMQQAILLVAKNR